MCSAINEQLLCTFSYSFSELIPNCLILSCSFQLLVCLDLDLRGDDRDFQLFQEHLLPLHQELFINLSNSAFLPFLAVSPTSSTLISTEGKGLEEEGITITSIDAFKSLSSLVDADAVRRHHLLSKITIHTDTLTDALMYSLIH
jgi:hypothetical protein